MIVTPFLRNLLKLWNSRHGFRGRSLSCASPAYQSERGRCTKDLFTYQARVMAIALWKLPFLEDSNWKELEGSLNGYGSLAKSVESAVGELPEGLLEDVNSSYKESGYPYLFYALVRLLSPSKICEIKVKRILPPLHGICPEEITTERFLLRFI